MTETNKNVAVGQKQIASWSCSANNRQTLEQYGSSRRHTIIEDPGAFRKLALSGDGNTLAAAASQVLCIFNTKTLERLDRFVFDCNIVDIAINGDGQAIFIVDKAKSIHVIDVPFSHRGRVATHRADIATMTVDSAGSRLAFADVMGSISILDTGDFREVSTVDCGFVPSKIVIRNDKDLLLAYGRRVIVGFRLSTAECLGRFGNEHEGIESCCLAEADLITETSGGFVAFETAPSEFRFIHTPRYRAYDTTPDGSVIVTARNYEFALWDTSRGTKTKSVRTYIREVGDVKICDEGQSVYVCGDDTTIDCYSVKGERLATFGDFYRPIMAAATTNEDRTLVVADEAGAVAVYDLVTGEANKFHLHSCCISKLHVEGPLVATGAHDCWARVLNLDSGEEIFNVNFPGAPVQAVSLDGDRYLATGNYLGQVQLYDLKKHELLREYHGNTSTVRSISISPCRRYLMSTNESGEVLIFDYESGDLSNQFKGFGIIYSGCFDESGEFLYYGDGLGSIRKARPTSRKILRCWPTHSTNVRSIYIRNNQLISIGISDKAHVLDLSSGKTLLDCPIKAKPFHRVAFTNASGTRLVTGGQDGCLMFHDANDGSIQAELHNLAHGFLWLTRGDDASGGYGDCFWTDQEELISVYNRVAGIETVLAPSSEEYKEYVRIHNNRAMTVARVGMTPATTEQANEAQLAACRDSIMDWNSAALLEQKSG